MIYDGTGSVEGSTGWYLVVLGQYGGELVDIGALGQHRAVLVDI